MLTVKLYTVRRRHGGFHCHATLGYDERPVQRRDERLRSLSRTFSCLCGEPLHDGDMCLVGEDNRTMPIHVNCEELM